MVVAACLAKKFGLTGLCGSSDFLALNNVTVGRVLC